MKTSIKTPTVPTVDILKMADMFKDGLEACGRSLKILSEGAYDILSSGPWSSAEKNATALFENAFRLTTAKSVPEAIQIHLTNGRALTETMLNDARRMTDGWLRTVGVASAPILEHAATVVGQFAA